MSAVAWAMKNWVALAFVALTLAMAVQTKRLQVAQADAKVAAVAHEKTAGLLAGCKENAQAFGKAAEIELARAAGREAVASEIAARQTEKALALAKLRAPADCAAGATWAAGQAREIAKDFAK
jgi:hypothetical protein